jgi:hypothetical protein
MLLLQLVLHLIQDVGRISSGEELEDSRELPPIADLTSFDGKP